MTQGIQIRNPYIHMRTISRKPNSCTMKSNPYTICNTFNETHGGLNPNPIPDDGFQAYMLLKRWRESLTWKYVNQDLKRLLSLFFEGDDDDYEALRFDEDLESWQLY